MTITICSSIEFTPKILEVKSKLEKLGFAVNIPYLTEKILNNEMNFDDYRSNRKQHGGDISLRQNESVDVIKRYWKLISESGAILVINETKNGVKNYIGGNTLMEMGFAYGHDKKIFLYNPIPEKGERMHYIDEILHMKPIVINKDLTRIAF